jgi:hypothetical protein
MTTGQKLHLDQNGRSFGLVSPFFFHGQVEGKRGRWERSERATGREGEVLKTKIWDDGASSRGAELDVDM